MKIITYRKDGGPVSTGVVIGEDVLDITAWIAALALSGQAEQHHATAGTAPPSGGIMRLLQAGSCALDMLAMHVQKAQTPSQLPTSTCPLKDVQLYAPVPRPGKIIGVGRNYADHAKETGVTPFESPRIIFKMPSSVAAPGAAVARPASVIKMDFEAELAVVIGSYGKDVTESQALALVAGYTILNDLSAREFQFDVSPAQTTFAKSMDGFAPMGPWLVTADEIEDPNT